MNAEELARGAKRSLHVQRIAFALALAWFAIALALIFMDGDDPVFFCAALVLSSIWTAAGMILRAIIAGEGG